MTSRTKQIAAVDEALTFVDTHRDHKPDTAMGREVKRVCQALAAEVVRQREDIEGLEGVRDQLREAIVEALRLYESGHPHGDVLRAALRGRP